MKKSKHQNWKGGKSKEKYFNFTNELKDLIRKRDENICQECGRSQKEIKTNISKKGKIKKLNVHHIDSNKKNNDPNNLITLCPSCHSKLQWRDREWEEYFKNKIKLNGKWIIK